MGDPTRPQARQNWTATLGGMLDHGTIVQRTCYACGRSHRVDVEAAVRKMGRAWSLWNDWQDCPRPDCTHGITYAQATTSPGTPLRPLVDYLVLRPGPADPPDAYTILPMWKHMTA